MILKSVTKNDNQWTKYVLNKRVLNCNKDFKRGFKDLKLIRMISFLKDLRQKHLNENEHFSDDLCWLLTSHCN